MSTIYADAETGQVVDSEAAHRCADAAVAFFDEEWRRVKATFDITEKEALGLAQKNVNAAVAAIVKSHHDFLAEDFKPKQTRMIGL